MPKIEESKIFKIWTITLTMTHAENPSVDTLEKMLIEHGFENISVAKEEKLMASE